jgi:hypothetical protein
LLPTCKIKNVLDPKCVGLYLSYVGNMCSGKWQNGRMGTHGSCPGLHQNRSLSVPCNQLKHIMPVPAKKHKKSNIHFYISMTVITVQYKNFTLIIIKMSSLRLFFEHTPWVQTLSQTPFSCYCSLNTRQCCMAVCRYTCGAGCCGPVLRHVSRVPYQVQPAQLPGLPVR